MPQRPIRDGLAAPSAADRSDTAARGGLALAYLVFFASGFAALLYQVIWQRMLALFSGADVFSVTLIVAAFMGGLGLGNLAGGHLADRLSRAGCFVWFAAAEAAIALFALASRAFYYDFLYARVGALDLGLGALAAILFASVLWPTFFMGLSLPLLARGLAHSLDGAARVIGSLYGWNTFGAAAGAFATTWVLLRRFDFVTILWIGAALNAACAFAAVVLARTPVAVAAPRTGTTPPAPTGGTPSFGFGAWVLLFFFSGALALALEIAWFRALGVVLKSTSFTFGTLLTVYLLGIALGSLAGTRVVERARDPGRVFLMTQTGVMAWAVLSLGVFWLLADPGRGPVLAAYLGRENPLPLAEIFSLLERRGLAPLLAPRAELHELGQLFLLLHGVLPVVLILPATLLMGFAFPFLQRAAQTDADALGRRVGSLQAANIAGSLGGSLITGFVLLPQLGTPGTFRALAITALAFPLLALLRDRSPRRAASPLLGVAVLTPAAVAFPTDERFWATLHGRHAEPIVVAEDAAGVSLARPDPEQALEMVMAGGTGVSSLPYGSYGGTHTLLGLVPVLIHPRPERVAVVGIGSGDTAYAAAARRETREVFAIEIVGSQLEVLRTLAARPGGDPGLRAFLGDPRIRPVVADGRAWLRRAARHFDVIEADALRPVSAYSGNLYSREYFALLGERLAPGGMAVTWLPTKRVVDTFASVFPHAIQLGNIGLASNEPIPYDPAAIVAAAQSPAIRDHFARAGVDALAFVRPFVEHNPPRVLAGPGAVPGTEEPNLDLFARDEFVAGRYRPIVPRSGATGPALQHGR